MTTGRSARTRSAVIRGRALVAAWACLLAAPAAAGADALVGPLPSPLPLQTFSPGAEATAAPAATASASSASDGGSGGTVALAVAGVAVVAVAVGAFAALRRLTPRRDTDRPAADGGQTGEAAAPPDDEAGG